MTKFTPGPWTVKTGFVQSANNLLYWQIEKDHDCIVANQFCYAADDEETSQANARLIAAAPDMYAALLNFIGGADITYVAALEIARAAITKADGEVK